jgi:hypothetical protein
MFGRSFLKPHLGREGGGDQELAGRSVIAHIAAV